MEPLYPPPISSTATSASEFRRSKARTHLLSKVTDRSIKGPVKWSKSVSEVQIDNYRNECRKLGAPSLFTRQHFLPSALCRKENDQNPDSLLMTYSYHLHGEEKRDTTDMQRNKNNKMFKNMAYGLEREMTLREIHQIMQAEGESASRQNADSVHLPRISINIQRASQVDADYPDVKLMLKRLPPPVLGLSGNQPGLTKPLTPFSQLRSQSFGPGDFTKRQKQSTVVPVRRESVVVDSERGRVNPMPLPTFKQLQMFEHNKMTSAQRTKAWMDNNPLGPEEPPEDVKEDMKVPSPSSSSSFHTTPETQFQSIQKVKEIHRTRPSTVFINDRINDSIVPVSAMRHFSKSAVRKPKLDLRDSAKLKNSKKVRFGTQTWLYKDNDYMFS